jgi:4-hydroxy-2-oxoheptanedioate aldolase
MAKSSFDAITIDLQHGMLDFEKCKDILQAIIKYDIFPIVRVPSNNIDIINKVIDAGAFGVICPLVNNKTDVAMFTNACFYPPKGNRSFGPTLVNIDYENYFQNSNKEILTIAMIETKESVDNLIDILKIKNLDMIYIGPWDLSISYGVKPDNVFKEKKMLKLYRQILMSAKKYDKKTAIHCSGADTGSFFLKMGFNMVTISTDLNILAKSLIEELNKIK